MKSKYDNRPVSFELINKEKQKCNMEFKMIFFIMAVIAVLMLAFWAEGIR